MPSSDGRNPPRLRRWRSLRVVVEDASMLPTLASGDRLWVDPCAVRSKEALVRGSIVVLKDPGQPDRWLVKRLVAVGPATVFVVRGGVEVREAGSTAPPPEDAIDRSDVPATAVYVVSDGGAGGRDSRSFGPVPMARLVGVVWYRYAPPARAGPIPNASDDP